MPKRKNNKIKYESVERVSRWNLCQQIASYLYQGKKSNKEHEEMLITFSYETVEIND